MPTELDLGPSARAFRDEVRGWLEANRPEELAGVEAEQLALQRVPGAEGWARKLHEAGLMCVSWPKEYGGRGLGGVEVAVLNEEFARAGVPRLTRGMGEWLVGPSIIVWGSDEQKAHFLPRIIDGTDRYCQGFSEPDAGSDQSLFTETFITEARAPLFNVISGVHGGWRVTMTTLGNERGGNATTQHVQYEKQFRAVLDEVRKLGRETDPIVRQHLAWAWTHVQIMRYQGLRTLSAVVARKEPGPASALNKMFWSEYAQRLGELVINIRGADSMVMPGGATDRGRYEPDRWQRTFLGTRSVTIWGGTAQVQRNIVGERVLGLPKDPPPGGER